MSSDSESCASSSEGSETTTMDDGEWGRGARETARERERRRLTMRSGSMSVLVFSSSRCESDSESDEEYEDEELDEGEEGKEAGEYFAEEGVGSGGRGKSNGLSLKVILNESGDAASSPSLVLLGTCKVVVHSSSSELLQIGTMLACLLSIFVFPSPAPEELVIMVNAGDGALRACSSFSAMQKRGTASSSSPESSWMI